MFINLFGGSTTPSTQTPTTNTNNNQNSDQPSVVSSVVQNQLPPQQNSLQIVNPVPLSGTSSPQLNDLEKDKNVSSEEPSKAGVNNNSDSTPTDAEKEKVSQDSNSSAASNSAGIKKEPVVSHLSAAISSVREGISSAFTKTNANPILVAAIISIIATLVIGVIAALCLSGSFPPPYQGGMIGCCCAVAGSFIVLVSSSAILYLTLRPQPRLN